MAGTSIISISILYSHAARTLMNRLLWLSSREKHQASADRALQSSVPVGSSNFSFLYLTSHLPYNACSLHEVI